MSWGELRTGPEDSQKGVVLYLPPQDTAMSGDTGVVLGAAGWSGQKPGVLLNTPLAKC